MHLRPCISDYSQGCTSVFLILSLMKFRLEYFYNFYLAHELFRGFPFFLKVICSLIVFLFNNLRNLVFIPWILWYLSRFLYICIITSQTLLLSSILLFDKVYMLIALSAKIYELRQTIYKLKLSLWFKNNYFTFTFEW